MPKAYIPESLEVRQYAVLQMKVAGHSDEEISMATGVPETTVREIIKEVADEARRERRELVNQHFMLHLRRTEKQYKMLQAKLDAYEKDPNVLLRWSDVLDTLKVMILILHRQSSLLGLDNQKTTPAGKGKPGVNDWIADPNVSPLKVLAEAKRMGIRVPESFVGEGFSWGVPLPGSE